MNFGASKKKVIVSIIVILCWFVLLQASHILFVYCGSCPQQFDKNSCTKSFSINLIPDGCNAICECPKQKTIWDLSLEITIILIPGILTYLIWSSLEKK